MGKNNYIKYPKSEDLLNQYKLTINNVAVITFLIVKEHLQRWIGHAYLAKEENQEKGGVFLLPFRILKFFC